MTDKIQQTFTIPDHLGGMRLDQALATFLPQFSRTQIQEWIKEGNVTVEKKKWKARDTVLGGELITIDAMRKAQPVWDAQPIDLNIIYEDEAIIIVNKSAGMVVHPAAGNYENTLLNALLHHAPTLQQLPRAGILHRLDKNTTGLLIIAKTYEALQHLSKQLKNHEIIRIYQAIAFGLMTSGGTINEPIGRHPVQRKRMAVIETGKEAVTHYRIVERYRAYTRLKVQLETGRTHQIRVHMAYIRHPLLGDSVYGGRLQLPKGASQDLIQELRTFKRQALHASELSITHPITNKIMTWNAPLPDDMEKLIKVLKSDAQG
ncbi:MAG: 23S rRNA pseudouridine(1911/1915/1917) synthase RluD [Gammaproteobacteria bacterium]|nr:23S rRNA pseudouridine(1911/1915/1917) synthase RluD [Gammaproteobacteria bacterium]